MSNLGNYQKVIELSKKFGGPERLAAAVFVTGAAIGVSTDRGGTQAVKRGKARLSKRKARKSETAATGELTSPGTTGVKSFAVTADGVDRSTGLSLHSGDSFRVLAEDGGSILIEVIGDSNNPYMVSGPFLATVSSFPANYEEPGA